MQNESDQSKHRPMLVDWNPAIGLQQLDGDAELLTEVVQLLASTMQARSSDMAEAAQQGRYLELRQHTHSMLASLKVLGFDEEARIFEAYEAAAVMSDLSACQRLGPQVQAIWSAIIQTLITYPHQIQA
jgi:hypothetical protein